MDLHFVTAALYLLFVAAGNVPRAFSQGHLELTIGARADLLRSCYNKYYNGNASVFEDFLRGFNTSLYLHEVFISAKRSDLPMTIFMGATMERLPALDAQCRSYPGPLSAALYIPLLQPQRGPQLTPENAEVLRRATARLKAMFDRLESSVAAATAASGTATSSSLPSGCCCSATLLLLYEVVSDPALAGLLPINSLRNTALLAAATPLVAMVDVDLATSATLPAELTAAAGSTAQQQQQQQSGGGGSGAVDLLHSCSQQRAVWVLPAWETRRELGMAEGTRVAERALAGDKSLLRRLELDSRLHYFAKVAYSRGHAATNFTRWLESDEPYVVPYEINYEPWFIMARELVPPYDVRFRGYGWNKVQQVALVASSNFTFWVHPRAWLVHRPHEKSRGQQLYGGRGGGGEGDQPQQQSRQGARQQRPQYEVRVWRGVSASLGRLFHRRVSALRHVALRDMRRGIYVAAVDPQTAACRGLLPWWGGMKKEEGERGRNG